jgi:hypothetical protein
MPKDEDGNDLNLEERYALIIARFQSNSVESRSAWIAVLDSLTDGRPYQIYIDHELGVIYVTLTYTGDAYQDQQLEDAMRAVTPAHLDINFQYDGFILGTSTLGDEL